MDWRSTSARPSVQNSPPSNAFKSLYKNNQARVHPSNTFPAMKTMRQNGECESSDRRDSGGGLGPDYLEAHNELRPQVASRLRRLRNTSPRVSECSSTGSDTELTRFSKQQRVVTDVNKTNNIVQEQGHPEERLILPQEERGDSVQDVVISPEIMDSIPHEQFVDLEKPELLEKSELSLPLEDSFIEEAVEAEDDEAVETEEKTPKKSKTKPRRRRFKKNKKPGAPLSEVSDNVADS